MLGFHALADCEHRPVNSHGEHRRFGHNIVADKACTIVNGYSFLCCPYWVGEYMQLEYQFGVLGIVVDS